MTIIKISAIDNHEAIEVSAFERANKTIDRMEAEGAHDWQQDALRELQFAQSSSFAERGITVFDVLVDKGVKKFVFGENEGGLILDLNEDEDLDWASSGDWDLFKRFARGETVRLDGDIAYID